MAAAGVPVPALPSVRGIGHDGFRDTVARVLEQETAHVGAEVAIIEREDWPCRKL